MATILSHVGIDLLSWFVEQGLPYRRGFLLYGPPGNGKTTAARIMACHKLVTTFSIDFSCEGMPNTALGEMFQAAEDKALALIILEDLDRVFGAGAPANHSAITLQHLLNCLDGLATQNGIVVVATANDPSTLDSATLKCPGRFDRLAAFSPPSLGTRLLYFRQLTGGALDEQSMAATESNRRNSSRRSAPCRPKPTVLPAAPTGGRWVSARRQRPVNAPPPSTGAVERVRPWLRCYCEHCSPAY